MNCSQGNNCAQCAPETISLFFNFKGCDEEVDSLPLMASPFPMLAIIATYLLFVLKYGREHMKNRQPYNLKNVIVAYNIFQVCASAYMFYLSITLSWPHGWIGKTCLLENQDTKAKLTTVLYYYFLAKVSELLETAFFILRKKYNQVSFLHVYHHTLMMTTSWIFLKYEPTYPTIFIRNINSFVHAIMYTYYALSSFPSLTKYLWWKKYITKLQLVQFALIIIHCVLSCMFSDCPPSFLLRFIIFGNASLFIYLFGKFYWNTYRQKINEEEKEMQQNNLTTASLKKNDNTTSMIMKFVTNTSAIRRKLMKGS